MKKIDLLALLANAGDEDDVNETLLSNEEIKGLIKPFDVNQIALEDFKKLLQENEKISGYWTSEKDRAISKGVAAYEQNTLPKKIEDAIKASSNKNKTPEQIALEELQAKFESLEAEKIKAENTNKYTKALGDKKLNPKLLDFLYSDDEKEFNTKLDSLVEIINETTNAGVTEKLNQNIYVPPSNGGGETLTGVERAFYESNPDLK